MAAAGVGGAGGTAALLAAVQSHYASLSLRMRARKSRLLHWLPVLVLALRVCLEALFRNAMPKW
jgi:hypothetical protein